MKPIIDPDCQTSFEKNDPSIIFWSSGTTGDPKGIVLDFSYALRMINFQENYFNAPDGDHETFLVTTNMFHIGGFFYTLLNGLRHGQSIIQVIYNQFLNVDIVNQKWAQYCDFYSGLKRNLAYY